MNVSVASLVELLNVPGSGAGYEVPWNGSLVEAGVEFPADYQDFINIFGRGAIGGELWVHSPLTAGPVGWTSGGFARMVARTTLEVGPMFNGLRASYPDLFPYPMFPDPGGLLEWGCNYNGDRCFWLTGDPDPDRWPVVVWFRGGARGPGLVESGRGHGRVPRPGVVGSDFRPARIRGGQDGLGP
ncbi:hypothetical protein [Kitasatospora sp. NPDC088548]|uniref:hypothetical protein n=1 Tax=Kitasatospora sp. NPDC088548 TaxID=3364075 RepID=UPI00380D00C3